MNPLDLRDSIATTLRLARAAAPAAAVASGLLGPAAWSAPGDLDPTFGDVGRVGPLVDLEGPAWTVMATDGGFCAGGGDEDCIAYGGGEYIADHYSYGTYGFHYDTSASGFIGRASPTGSIDPADVSGLANTQVLDLVIDPDRRVVGVGRTLKGDLAILTVFRLNVDGTLDRTFGVGGLVHAAPDGVASVASSVVLEPDGRIVVAGLQEERLIVLRLLANGDLDSTFAESGVFSAFDTTGRTIPRILRVDNGGYRVTSHGLDYECRVLALTSSGAVDTSFGASGLAGLNSEYVSTCNSMAAQDNGRLLVAGRQNNGGGFAIRLLADGERDDTFAASAVAEAMVEATALDVSDGGSIVVAGRSAAVAQAALVMRLQASGALDTIFGNGGSTVIELPSERGTQPVINDIMVQGGKVLVAGGDRESFFAKPFVARLLTDDSADGPGVIGVLPPQVTVNAGDVEAVVTVRRTGGRAGPVSVLLQTQPATPPPAHEIATAGEDFTPTTRTLTWEDGDVADQQVAIPILPDADGAVPDEYEIFNIVLSARQGGAGLGTRTSTIVIPADGEPNGQFAIRTNNQTNILESSGVVDVIVSRNYYLDGPVSITVSAVAGTATAGEDFTGDPVTLTWEDQAWGEKTVRFTIINDVLEEDAEQFSIQLSAPTGGALVGPRSTVSFTILANDQPPPTPPPKSKSGGGGVGLMSMLLLGFAGLLRQAPPWATRLRRHFGTAKAQSSVGGGGSLP